MELMCEDCKYVWVGNYYTEDGCPKCGSEAIIVLGDIEES